MQIIDIIDKIEEDLKLKDNITEELYKSTVELAKLNKEYKNKLYLKIYEVQNKTRLPLQVAEGILSNDKFNIDIAESKKILLYNKLENIRQELMILSSMLKNESELIK